MQDKRQNLQGKQPGIEYWPEGNGWPKPLTDPSDKLKVGVTNGKEGKTEQSQVSSFSKGLGEKSGNGVNVQ